MVDFDATLTIPKRSFPVICRGLDNVVGFLTPKDDFGFLKSYNLKTGNMTVVIMSSDEREMRKLDRLCRHTVKLKIREEINVFQTRV